jgi:hypothetical protein
MIEGLALGTVEDEFRGAFPPTGGAARREPGAGIDQYTI